MLELSLKRLHVDWTQLYGESRPQLISLPTYPFSKERYWIPATSVNEENFKEQSGAPSSIHPLLQQNKSDLSEQRFSSLFTGQEFFLSDHVVNGLGVLPGVAYLEMAREAVDQAAGFMRQGQSQFKLKNIVWTRPITVCDQPVRVSIALFAQDNETIAYEIYSEAEDGVQAPVIHSQGVAELHMVESVSALDIEALQARCNQGRYSSDKCYTAFKAMGIDYGPAHRGLKVVYAGQG